VLSGLQGKRADSYLRFLDKDGARGARLGVVHQLFTSEDADPGVMARIGLQRERFPPPRASGRCRFGQRTFAGPSGNDEHAPNPDLRQTASFDPRAVTDDRPTIVPRPAPTTFRSAVLKPSVNRG
jgi:hypothetical protein